jgi:hypothetical protein
MKRILGLIVLGCAALGCAADSGENTNAAPQQGGDNKGDEVTLDKLKSRVPAAWKAEKPTSKLRTAQFRVPKAEGDKEDAELAIFYFKGSGGSVDANIARWKGFFIPPEGKTIDEVSKVEKFKVGQADVTYLDIHGTFKSKDPSDPKAREELKPHFRRFGVVFESPNGPYFITLTGPARTLEQHKAGFDGWIKGFK